MKKTLLFTLLTATFVSAQTLQTEDFNALTLGNVATSTAAGQGGWYLDTSNGTAPTTSTNAGFTNAQIITSGGSNALQVVGPNGDKGGRFIWKDGVNTAWATRTSGNNIIEIEADINPGAISTSQNLMGVYIYDSTYAKVLAGFAVNASTGELYLVCYSTSGTTTANYSWRLAAAPGIILPASQVSRIGVSYNKTTGQVRIKGPGIAAAGLALTGAAIATDPLEVDVIAVAGGTTTSVNTAAATMVFDNLTVKATAADSLLGTNTFDVDATYISLFPNPTTGIINIDTPNNAEVKNMQLVDVNGRVIKTINGFVSQLDITSLSNGVYMLTIETATAKETKKIIKN